MDAATLSALGEPSRLQLVELLRTGPYSVSQLVERLGIRQPQVSKHLRVLSGTGIVAAERAGRHRIYHLEDAPFEQVADWVDTFEKLWEVRLDSLGAFLESIESEDDDDRRH